MRLLEIRLAKAGVSMSARRATEIMKTFHTTYVWMKVRKTLSECKMSQVVTKKQCSKRLVMSKRGIRATHSTVDYSHCIEVLGVEICRFSETPVRGSLLI
jgi:hypothetical protein